MLHGVIRDHLDGFLRAAADRADGASLPEFIAREFREFLTCGVLAHGFARVRCERCAFEHLVPFSCKGRGFCPSCGGRRMTERAAHLVDGVIPPVPVRQWVLTPPFRLRYLLAWDHGLGRAVLAVHTRALLALHRIGQLRATCPGIAPQCYLGRVSYFGRTMTALRATESHQLERRRVDAQQPAPLWQGLLGRHRHLSPDVMLSTLRSYALCSIVPSGPAFISSPRL